MALQPLQSLLDEFIQSQKDLKGERTFETYGRKISVFCEYIEHIGIDDKSYEAFLHTAEVEQIIDSVKYYTDTYNIKYRATTDAYCAALNVFFEHIQKYHGIQNEFFSVSSKERRLKDAYEQFVKKAKLNSSEQTMPISDEQCELMLNICDDTLSKYTIDEILRGRKRGVFTQYSSALITKFVMLYGIKNGTFKKIHICDYDNTLNKIVINGFSIHLPDKLAKQMKDYIVIRNQIDPFHDAQAARLFTDATPSRELENAKMFLILEQVTGNRKAISVAKYAIIQMLVNGVPLDVVHKFTDYAESVCGHCQEIIDQGQGLLGQREKNRILDSALRKHKFFDEL